MFVRLKGVDAANVTLVAHRIIGMAEGQKLRRETAPAAEPTDADPFPQPTYEEVVCTMVVTEAGTFYVTESERVIRSKILKAGDPVEAEA